MSATRLPGTPRLLRALNDRAALELLLARGPLTRAQLGELTGLSKVTASQLVERLEERGLVARVGEQAGGRGPNAQLYAVRPGSAHVIGVDVGAGTGGGRLRGHHRRDRRAGGAVHRDTDDPVGVVHTAVVQAAEPGGRTAGQRPAGGARHPRSGRSGDRRHHLRLRPAPLAPGAARRRCGEDLHTPVVFENDVNLAAVAEAHTGAARGVGGLRAGLGRPGVGLAIVLGGRLHHGSSGAAGEIGYLPVPGRRFPGTSPAGPSRAFQQLAGADAVRAVARKHGFRGAERGRRGARRGRRRHRRRPGARRAGPPAGARGGQHLRGARPAAGGARRRGGPGRRRGAGRAGAARGGRDHPGPPRVVITEVTEEPILQGALRTALDAVRDEVFGSTVGLMPRGGGLRGWMDACPSCRDIAARR